MTTPGRRSLANCWITVAASRTSSTSLSPRRRAGANKTSLMNLSRRRRGAAYRTNLMNLSPRRRVAGACRAGSRSLSRKRWGAACSCWTNSMTSVGFLLKDVRPTPSEDIYWHAPGKFWGEDYLEPAAERAGRRDAYTTTSFCDLIAAKSSCNRRSASLKSVGGKPLVSR